MTLLNFCIDGSFDEAIVLICMVWVFLSVKIGVWELTHGLSNVEVFPPNDSGTTLICSFDDDIFSVFEVAKGCLFNFRDVWCFMMSREVYTTYVLFAAIDKGKRQPVD